MAKKVKCIECDNSMDWAIPECGVLKSNNILIHTLQNTIVCGQTMKTKLVNHCQYCKHYEHEGDHRQKCREIYERELAQALEKLKGEEHEYDKR